MENENKEISKIKIDGAQYNIKDAELREMIKRLAGDIKPVSKTSTKVESK